jgi:hypothetical protein
MHVIAHQAEARNLGTAQPSKSIHDPKVVLTIRVTAKEILLVIPAVNHVVRNSNPNISSRPSHVVTSFKVMYEANTG